MYNDILCHHGIKGQKWGVRRYQNPDGSLTPAGRERYRTNNSKEHEEINTKQKYLAATPIDRLFAKNIATKDDVIVPTGTKLQRISSGSNSDYTKGVFASYKVSDKDLYTGVLGRIRADQLLKRDGDVALYKMESKLSKEIKIPGEDAVRNSFKELYDRDPDSIITFMNQHFEDTHKNRRVSKIDSDNVREVHELYRDFNEALGEGVEKKPVSDFYKILRDKGYDAILDENDTRRGTFKGQAPIIMFDTEDLLRDGAWDVRELTPGEVFGSYNRSIFNKVLRDKTDIFDRGYVNMDPDSKKAITKYERIVNDDINSFNDRYTLTNLADDWSNGLTSSQIISIQKLMDAGKTHEEAVSQVYDKSVNSVISSVTEQVMPDAPFNNKKKVKK